MEIPNNTDYDHQPKYDEPEVKKEKPELSTKKFSGVIQKIGNIKFKKLKS